MSTGTVCEECEGLVLSTICIKLVREERGRAAGEHRGIQPMSGQYPGHVIKLSQ